MRKHDIEKLRTLLLEKREKIVHDLGQLKEGEMSSTLKDASGENSAYSFHMADVGTDNQEREKAFLFATKEGRFLYHLDQALERIENGTYGLCHECGNSIGVERLKAVPHARLCITCKSNEEQKKN